MIDIKLRAWDKKHKRIVNVRSINFGTEEIITFTKLYNAGYALGVQDYELMQFTGLKDKNGKKDWIDDIVKTKVGQMTYYRKIVQAESGAYCISLPIMGATGYEGLIMLITCEHENVGNIHKNPELLEVKE